MMGEPLQAIHAKCRKWNKTKTRKMQSGQGKKPVKATLTTEYVIPGDINGSRNLAYLREHNRMFLAKRQGKAKTQKKRQKLERKKQETTRETRERAPAQIMQREQE